MATSMPAGGRYDRSVTPSRRQRRGRLPPSRWGTRRNRGGRYERVVEQVVERMAPLGNYPMLAKTNYFDWAALMKVMLQARNLWDVVSTGAGSFVDDWNALEVISKAVPPELMGVVASKATARDAWDMLWVRNIGVDRVRKAKASTLKRDFDALKFNDGESVDDFSACIGWTTGELAVLGKEYTEEEVVRKFLQALPSRFDQIAASIETLLDLSKISVDELVGRLKAVEERLVQERGVVLLGLNLTEDELVSRITSRLKIAGNGGSSSTGGSSAPGNDQARGRGRGRGHGRNGGCHGGARSGRGGRTIANDECRYYGNTGHWARECKKKSDEQAHVAQADEGDEALLVADACIDVAVVEDDVVTQSSDVTSGATAPTEVHLNENKLFIQLGDKGGVRRPVGGGHGRDEPHDQ
jgi:hypothetical protein